MRSAEDDYRRALAEIAELPAQFAAALNQSKLTHARAIAVADQAVESADALSSDSLRSVEDQLADARTVLGRLGKANLVPPHIRPSGGAAGGTRDDVAAAQQALAVSVNCLRQAVEDEVRRAEVEERERAREAAERAQLAREAAERAAAAMVHRKKILRLSSFVAVFLALAVIVLVIIL